MAEILPKGEALRQALRWLADRHEQEPQTPRQKLVDEAAMRFDLTPMDVDFLLANWK